MKKIVSLCLMLAVLSIPASAVVIGDWEDASGDGWIDWGSQESVATTTTGSADYAMGATVGATTGSQSLQMTDQGWGQTLAIKLTEAQRADFMTNSIFSIDYSVAADTLGVGGFARIQGIVINADGLGWTGTDLGTTANFWFWSGSSERTQTLEFDYSAFKGSINPNPSYVEIILETNGQRDTTPEASPYSLYFDNAQLIVPEPATLSLLGLGAVALLRRKK